MKFHPTKILIILLLGITFVTSAQDIQPIPELNNPVIDLTGTLTSSEMGRLSSTLYNYAEQTGSQVVVLIIPTTSPEDIASYGIRVAEEWKLGRTDIDDGVLLLVAKDDRDVRIEVGYGLEGPIPDAYAKRIIENLIIPNFRNGQFYEGIAEGVGAIMGLIDGEELPGVTQSSQSSQGDGKGKKSLAYLMILMIIGVSIGKAFIKKPVFKVIAAIIIAIIIGFVFANVVMFIVSLILSIIMLFANGGRGGGGIGGGGVFYGGGFGGGGSSGGGGGFGGFSGGGGGFGGGGASGSW
jgi:uncharacterized protein